jgi:cation diffusion facilitator CzcD-associated flavoprotein CzcO
MIVQPGDHVDVLVIGAGISGIGAGYYVQRDLPGRTYAILEARDDIGGTWDLFRYPGIRSDSDLYTFGYEFHPWRAPESIASGSAILAYLHEVADTYGIDRHIHLRHRAMAVRWSSEEAVWQVDVEHGGEVVTMTASWLIAATGYYRYDAGYTPDLPGLERFTGPVIHPQSWPDDLDYAGRRVVIIGSGATAVTLAPAMAATAGHVTILQRTPTYVLSMPSADPLAPRLRSWLGDERTHAVLRRISIVRQRATYRFAQSFPQAARRFIRWENARALPPGYPVDVHFNPPYGPWDQRLCLAPDGDLFAAISDGTVSMATDRIAAVTETGIDLASGQHLPADIIVTATGLQVEPFGGIAVTVDGRPVRPSDTLAYKGFMLSGIPNLAFVIGYTNASWTLKIGLLYEHLCRLIRFMDAEGYDSCTPRPATVDMSTRPYLDFAAGYIRRAVEWLPRQGDRWPWLASTGYAEDVRLLRRGRVVEPELEFGRGRSVATRPDASRVGGSA